MENLMTRLRNLLGRHKKATPKPGDRSPHMHVVSPDSVTLPFPRSPRDEICVPASINGRDLSTGRL